MTLLKVTAKGQVTLRKELLRHLGVGPGDRIAVEPLPAGRLEIRADQPAGSIEDFIGCLERPGGPVLSLEEIAALAAEGWAGRR